MRNDEYEKVFQHISGLSQRHALGQIPDATFYQGLKKLLEEMIAANVALEMKKQRRTALIKGAAMVLGLLGIILLLGFVFWKKGWLKGSLHWIGP